MADRLVTRVIAGIDPGQSGAVAVLADGEFYKFIDMPVMSRPAGGQQINGAELAAALRGIWHEFTGASFTAVLEQVSARPKQGVSSMFRFGEGYGVIQGVVATLGMQMVMVHPAKWKKAAGLSGKEKDCARTLAIQRFPSAATQLTRKKDVGRADALLIAQFGFANRM